MRKIVQVAVAGVQHTASMPHNWITTALCDDGSVWQIGNNFSHRDERAKKWKRLSPIPQDEEPAP